MNKLILLPVMFLCIAFNAQSQKNKDKKRKASDEETKAIMEQITADTTLYLRSAGQNACKCIDSVNKAESNNKKKIEGISDCIDKEVTSYEMMVQLMSSLKSTEKTKTITISEKGSDSYKTSYYEIERWLKDSCAEMNRAIATNDEAGEKSFSKNPEAMDAYNKGVKLMQQEKYAECIPFFEKAVNIDSVFAFAWDNLGVSYRRINNFEKAEWAYKSSLAIDPSGKTALQNLPVVYIWQKKSDEAIAAYMEILKYYPGDAEVYYGIAIVYYENKKNMNLALDYMCKAYNIYVHEKSPYRSDAEKVINTIYTQMKNDNKLDEFNKILKDNNIKGN